MAVNYAQDDSDGASRAAYLKSAGRPVRAFEPHKLDPALQAKLDKIMRIKAKRDDLRRVREIAAGIESALERQLAQARRSCGAEPGWLLQQARWLRAELDALDL